jgi:cell division protein FtsI (penicillin-binding protein 3)
MTVSATRTPRRRTAVAMFAVLVMIGVFVIRLVDIQVVNAATHVADSHATDRLGVERVLPGVRGGILDSDGVALATSVVVYDAQLDPSLIFEIEDDTFRPPTVSWAEASEQIAAIIEMDAADIRQLVNERLAENPDSQYLPLIKSLDTDQYLRLRELNFPYLAMIPRETRVYPNGAVAGNIVGFTGIDGEGLAGMELMYEQCLAGLDGKETFLRGANGVRIPGTERKTDPVAGGTLSLTINSDLNWYLQQMIASEVKYQNAKSGTVVVVEVATGKIRAAAEYPVVDPNNVDASKPADRGSRIFTSSFEPASTFKTMTAAMVLEETSLTPLSTTITPSSMTFPNGAEIGDYNPHPTYNYTLAGALIDSSNVAYSKFGAQVPASVRHDYLKAFGVGEGTGINFPGEAMGLLHPADKWDNQSIYTTTFGQYFTVTVPQVASAYQTIANGGVRSPLRIVESCTLADGTVIEPELRDEVRVISEQTAAELQLMLENVASQNSLAKSIAVSGYRIAMKTGTAEKPGNDGKYKSGVYFASMAGFAPAEDPQYVVVVTLDEPTRSITSGSTASAFQKAMAQVLKTYRVLPSTGPTDKSLPKVL